MYADMMDTIGFVSKYDEEVGKAMNLELARQQRNIELIASENIVSPAVMAAMGSVLTNKYAEGYPGKRYYGGCEDVDIVENIARDRAEKLFGAKFANVQPHSGAQANIAVYFALLNPGDTVMGMNLAEGGHLTHGSPVNLSGKYFNFVPYGINEEGYIDYDELEQKALSCKPKMIVAGASAYPRIIDFKRISEIAKKVGAYLMVDMAHIAGLVAAGLHPSPVPYADVVTDYNPQNSPRPARRYDSLQRRGDSKGRKQGNIPRHAGRPAHAHNRRQGCLLRRGLKARIQGAYQQKVLDNCKALANGFTKYGVDLVSGGRDNHPLLLDLRSLHITGKELSTDLDEVYITANKNAIPNDPEKPFVTSGIRVGTPAVTTRGLDEADMEKIAEYIYLCATDFEGKADYIREGVNDICARHPLYR